MSRFASPLDTAVRAAFPKNPDWIDEHVANITVSVTAMADAAPCSLEVAKTKAREAQGLKRMGKKRFAEILSFAEQVGAVRTDGDGIVPVLDSEALDGIQILSRQGLNFTAVAPEVDSDDLGHYEDDAGLRLIALQGSTCWGNWDEGDASCGGCPLRAHCAVATFDRMEAIARDLDRKVEAQLLEAAQAAAKEAPSPEPTESDESDENNLKYRPLSEVAAALGGTVIESSPFEANCFHCPDPIPAGSTNVVIRGKGACHEACARTLASTKEA